jgi:hypothetical protein
MPAFNKEQTECQPPPQSIKRSIPSNVRADLRKRPLAADRADARLPIVNSRIVPIFALCVTFMGPLEAKRPAPASMSLDARLYVAPMEWGLDRFVADEIRKQGLPVQLVSTEDEADFVMTSLYQQLGSHLIAPGHYIQVRIVASSGGKAVWSDEVNDFAAFFGRLRPHGPGRAAIAIVKKLRNNLAGLR